MNNKLNMPIRLVGAAIPVAGVAWLLKAFGEKVPEWLAALLVVAAVLVAMSALLSGRPERKDGLK